MSIAQKRPTKRAPDAGDSAHIPSSFTRLIIFLAGRLRRPRPSAGNANRWALALEFSKDIMNINVKPMWLIIGSLIFGYIGLYVPGIKVEYQIVESGKNVTSPETRLVNVWSDKDGRDIPPCDLGIVKWSSKQLHWAFIGFRMFGIGAQFITFWLWYFYATRRDIGRRKFFFILVGLVWVPVALLVIFGSRQANLCNSSHVYKIMNFTPYYPALLLWIIGLALGYLAYRSVVQALKAREIAKDYVKS